jgi:hypothetical protein
MLFTGPHTAWVRAEDERKSHLKGNVWGCTDDVAHFWPPGAVQLRLNAEPHPLEKPELTVCGSPHASRSP